MTSRNPGLCIPSLDGIRAVAAMIVFVAHCGYEDKFPGGFGVTIFFFLSGYLITTLLRLEYEASGRLSFKKFYLRRAYRIFPPMYIVLAIGILRFVWSSENEMIPSAVLAQFLHLTNYYVMFMGSDHIVPATGPMWSLAVEEHFYILYPLLLSFLLHRYNYTRIGWILLFICVLVLVWRCVLVFFYGVDENRIFLGTDTRIDSLLFGCVMGIALNPALDKHFDSLPGGCWMLAIALSIALLLISFMYRNAEFRGTLRYTLQGVALFPIFFYAIRYSSHPMFRWLNYSWVRALGLISYTFYLSHLLILGDLAKLHIESKVLFIVTGLTITIAFSAAMYFLVERRLAVLRRKLHS